MLRSNYQTICFDQEYVHTENPAVSPSLAQRLSAFAAGMFTGVGALWNVLTAGLQVRTDRALFPAWYK
jgi:hypothetical protein